MGQQRLNQKKTAAPTRTHPTKTSVKSPVHPVEELQAAIGNREMGRLMETNRLPHPSSPFPKLQGELPLLGGMPVSQGTIQRQPLFRGLSQELNAEMGTLALPETGAVVQRKLTLGTPGDMYEQEADRVARQVVDEIHSSPFREQNPQMEEERKPEVGEAGRVQRQLTVRASGDAGGELSSEWEGELQRAKSGGQPLSPSVKEPMERAFGADFGGVRVHTGAQADRLARTIQAKAFTTGQDVFFRQGAYEPGSRRWEELLAHELTHVVQQDSKVIHRVNEKLNSSGINVQDQFLEVVAHKLIYKKSLLQKDKELLERNGYKSDYQESAELIAGVKYAILIPKEEEKNKRPPILVFKGTNDTASVLQDLDLNSPGFTGMSAYLTEEKIRKLQDIQEKYGKFVLTGHSLGGGLAQHLYGMLMSRESPVNIVSRLVTFQAAAVNAAQYNDKLNSLPEKAEVVHHRAKSDPVPYAGGDHITGTTYQHSLPHIEATILEAIEEELKNLTGEPDFLAAWIRGTLKAAILAHKSMLLSEESLAESTITKETEEPTYQKKVAEFFRQIILQSIYGLPAWATYYAAYSKYKQNASDEPPGRDGGGKNSSGEQTQQMMWRWRANQVSLAKSNNMGKKTTKLPIIYPQFRLVSQINFYRLVPNIVRKLTRK